MRKQICYLTQADLTIKKFTDNIIAKQRPSAISKVWLFDSTLKLSYPAFSPVQCWIRKDGKNEVESSSVQGCTTLHMICWQLHKCTHQNVFLNRFLISTSVHYSIYAKYEGPCCFLMINWNVWSKLFILIFWSAQFLRLLMPCRNKREQFWRKQGQSIAFHAILK